MFKFTYASTQTDFYGFLNHCALDCSQIAKEGPQSASNLVGTRSSNGPRPPLRTVSAAT